MKKILLMLGILGLIQSSASAQVGTGSPQQAPMKQGDRGEKINMVVGRNKNNSAATGKPMVYAPPTTKITSAHHVTHHTAYHKPVHHSTTGHTYAHKSTVNSHHTVAMHHPAKHHTYAAHYVKGAHTKSYTGNSAVTVPTTPGAPGFVNKDATSTTNTNTTIKRSGSYKENMGDGNYKYPGASDGGWHDGTNGQSGTRVDDGTIKVERK